LTDWLPLRKIAFGRATNARSRPSRTSTVTSAAESILPNAVEDKFPS